jgi:hypothetical protein
MFDSVTDRSELKIFNFPNLVERFKVAIGTSSVADPECLSWIPDPNFFHPGSRISDPWSKRLPDPHPHQRIVSELSEIWSGMFIPDPDLDFYPSRIPVPGFRGQKGTGSRIPDPDPQHCGLIGAVAFLCSFVRTCTGTVRRYGIFTLCCSSRGLLAAQRGLLVPRWNPAR